MSLIRLSLSVRHRKMQLIIFSSYVRRIFWSFCIADITLDITSNPTIFFIISLLCRYFAENILIICSTISGEYLVAYSYINRSSYTRPYLLFYSFLSNWASYLSTIALRIAGFIILSIYISSGIMIIAL